MGKTEPTPQGEENVGRQEEIAYIIERKDAEHNIEDGTDGTKSKQIEDGVRGFKASDGVVNSCYSDNDDGPYGTDKESEGEGQVERIERGVEIVVSPLFGTKGLDGVIGCCRTGHENA